MKFPESSFWIRAARNEIEIRRDDCISGSNPAHGEPKRKKEELTPSRQDAKEYKLRQWPDIVAGLGRICPERRGRRRLALARPSPITYAKP
jgi:hypothetical protein